MTIERRKPRRSFLAAGQRRRRMRAWRNDDPGKAVCDGGRRSPPHQGARAQNVRGRSDHPSGNRRRLRNVRNAAPARQHERHERRPRPVPPPPGRFARNASPNRRPSRRRQRLFVVRWRARSSRPGSGFPGRRTIRTRSPSSKTTIADSRPYSSKAKRRPSAR